MNAMPLAEQFIQKKRFYHHPIKRDGEVGDCTFSDFGNHFDDIRSYDSGQAVALLPIGSTLDNSRGIFYWLPGAGFLGQYQFVFVEKTADGQYPKKLVNVEVTPKH